MTETRTKTIEHRGRTYQVHVAHLPGAGDTEDHPRHLHIQDLEGGAGEVVEFDSPRAREFARAHREDLKALGYDDAAEREEEAAAARRAREQEDADNAERDRIRRLMGTGDQPGDQEAVEGDTPEPPPYGP